MPRPPGGHRGGTGTASTFFVAATEPPRLHVERSDRDALGGFGLQGSRARFEAADQHVIVEPALTTVTYDDVPQGQTGSYPQDVACSGMTTN